MLTHKITITDKDGKVLEEYTATEAPVVMGVSKNHESKMRIVGEENPAQPTEISILKNVIHGVILFRHCSNE